MGKDVANFVGVRGSSSFSGGFGGLLLLLLLLRVLDDTCRMSSIDSANTSLPKYPIDRSVHAQGNNGRCRRQPVMQIKYVPII